ncbi:hypothetical protein RHSIM_Rhsim05G0098400 [Rhododendron simsii]|uniref:Uncharacterized protein n=1 Tax=Rhododendron simsii TaxID=118357 RepID=A0A834GYG3_RHOSS|nr:hypothetical protein RHSIM_Rhsim05G0098400 [Rhododendron simsii]
MTEADRLKEVRDQVRVSSRLTERGPKVVRILSPVLRIRFLTNRRKREVEEILLDCDNPRPLIFFDAIAMLREVDKIDRKIERNKEVGPSAGVLVAVEDNICTVDDGWV